MEFDLLFLPSLLSAVVDLQNIYANKLEYTFKSTFCFNFSCFLTFCTCFLNFFTSPVVRCSWRCFHSHPSAAQQPAGCGFNSPLCSRSAFRSLSHKRRLSTTRSTSCRNRLRGCPPPWLTLAPVRAEPSAWSVRWEPHTFGFCSARRTLPVTSRFMLSQAPTSFTCLLLNRSPVWRRNQVRPGKTNPIWGVGWALLSPNQNQVRRFFICCDI